MPQCWDTGGWGPNQPPRSMTDQKKTSVRLGLSCNSQNQVFRPFLKTFLAWQMMKKWTSRHSPLQRAKGRNSASWSNIGSISFIYFQYIKNFSAWFFFSQIWWKEVRWNKKEPFFIFIRSPRFSSNYHRSCQDSSQLWPNRSQRNQASFSNMGHSITTWTRRGGEGIMGEGSVESPAD